MTKINLQHRMVGWVGALCIVIAYLFLTIDVVDSDSVPYNVLNLTGGILLAYRVYVDRNWSNVFLNLFFAAVAVLALSQIVL